LNELLESKRERVALHKVEEQLTNETIKEKQKEKRLLVRTELEKEI